MALGIMSISMEAAIEEMLKIKKQRIKMGNIYLINLIKNLNTKEELKITNLMGMVYRKEKITGTKEFLKMEKYRKVN